MSALVLGATGLCGSAFLKYAEQSKAFEKVFTITRRELPEKVQTDKLTAIVDKNTENWANLIPEGTDVLFTGLATTRAAAGGLDNQYKIDHDLNVDLAKAAKERGCKTIVLVSSQGANPSSFFFYMKMKGEIERDIINLGFEKTIILRPGPLLGERAGNFKGFGNAAISKLGGLLYKSKLQPVLSYPVYGDEVGKAGVILALDKSRDEKVQIVSSSEILKLAE